MRPIRSLSSRRAVPAIHVSKHLLQLIEERSRTFFPAGDVAVEIGALFGQLQTRAGAIGTEADGDQRRGQRRAFQRHVIGVVDECVALVDV